MELRCSVGFDGNPWPQASHFASTRHCAEPWWLAITILQVGHDPRVFLGDTRRFIICIILVSVFMLEPHLRATSMGGASTKYIGQPESTWVAIRFGVGENARKHERYEHSAAGPRNFRWGRLWILLVYPRTYNAGDPQLCLLVYNCWFIIPMNTLVVSCFIINHSYWSSKPI